MIWTLSELRSYDGNMVENGEKWTPARPQNWKYRTIAQRFKEAWMVFWGGAEAFVWQERNAK